MTFPSPPPPFLQPAFLWLEFVKLTKDVTLCMKERRNRKQPNFVRISLEIGICDVTYIQKYICT
jgi:hypothetical protein